MREIKFRAWDTEEKKWTYFEMGWSFDEMLGYITFHPMPAPEASARYDIMQFTGLFDVKSREIYEGDIVVGDGVPKSQVKFLNGSFFASSIKAASFLTDILHIEILGNIYENPEHLTEKKNETAP